MIKVLIVDDQRNIRRGLETLLCRFSDIAVIGTASNGTIAIAAADERQPDVILMDIRMPENDGIAATRAIREAHPHIHILILTTFVEDELIAQALQAGATGYLLKDTPPEDLEQAIKSAHKGYGQIAPQLVSSLAKHPARAETRAPLSKREQEVLSLIATGASNQEIADILNIARKTVKNHVSSILSQLKLHNRTEAALYAQSLLET